MFLIQNEADRWRMGVSARKHIEMNYDVVKLSQKIKSVVKFVVL
jgi:hypothetical protein